MNILKELLLLAMATSILGCEANNERKETEQATLSSQSQSDEEAVKEIAPSITNLDATVANHVQEIVNHYIHVKTALVNSNSAEAKTGARMITNVISGFDRSQLPAAHKSEYDKSATGISRTAQLIAAEPDLEKQRTIFADLSNSVYSLVTAFGAEKPIYHDHCPMALNDKGAMWLSEVKEIRNPYFGEEMMECGTVEEVIKR